MLLALRFGLAAALIWAMVRAGWLNLARVASIASKPGLLAAAAVLMLLGLVLTIVRWQTLLAVQGIRPRPREVFRLSFIGFFFSCVIPGSISGDAVKAWMVAKTHGKAAEAVTTVLMDRFFGLYTFVLTAAAAILAYWSLGKLPAEWSRAGLMTLTWFILGLAGAMTVFLLVVLSRRARASRRLRNAILRLPLGGSLAKLHDAVHLYRDHRASLAAVFLLSVAAQVPMILCNYTLGKAIGDGGLAATAYFFLAPLGLVINTIPALPGGVGTGEAGYKVLFSAFGSDAGAEVAALWHVLFFAWSLPGLVLYLAGRRTPAPPHEQSPGSL